MLVHFLFLGDGKGAVSVDVIAAAGGARPMVDFRFSLSGTSLADNSQEITLVWEEGDVLEKTIRVEILEDDFFEPEERFFLALSRCRYIDER